MFVRDPAERLVSANRDQLIGGDYYFDMFQPKCRLIFGGDPWLDTPRTVETDLNHINFNHSHCFLSFFCGGGVVTVLCALLIYYFCPVSYIYVFKDVKL